MGQPEKQNMKTPAEIFTDNRLLFSDREKPRVMIEFIRDIQLDARKIARERDEALAKLARWESGELRLACAHEKQALDFAAQTQRALAERDEADRRFVAVSERLDIVANERDALRAELEAVKAAASALAERHGSIAFAVGAGMNPREADWLSADDALTRLCAKLKGE